MNGNETLYNKYLFKINNILNSNKEVEYLKSFYNYMGTKLSISTRYNYINYVLNFIKYLKYKDVSKINLDDYTEFIGTISECTPSYQIAVYSALKKFSKYLEASNKNSMNPMQYIERPNPSEKQSTIIKRNNGFLEEKEIVKYLRNVTTGINDKRKISEVWKIRDYSIIILFLNLGIRCSALYKLDVSSINFENKILITTEKRNKTREYELSDDVCNVLLNWLDVRKEILGDINEDALFISDRRTRIDNSSIYRIVNKYSKNIEGKNITPHKLRATYGTLLYNKTKDLYFVQDRMGHVNPKTTELYIRGQKSNNGKKAADIMSSLTFK